MGVVLESRSKRARRAPQKNQSRTLIYLAGAVFFIKLIIIFNVPGNAWLGADGENYISAYNALVKDGIFSSERLLHYWPAGYPLFLLLLSFFSESWLFATLTILQSAIYSFATAFLAQQLLKTKFNKYSFFVFILIILNPTLSLSSIVIGYESLAASGLLIILALLVQDVTCIKKDLFIRNLLLASFTVAFISFFQPRLLLSGLVALIIWVLVRRPVKAAVFSIIIATTIVAIAPGTLIIRNQKANNFSVVSTNLGVTMNLGAGDKANGAYDLSSDYGVKCSEVLGDAAAQDRHLVSCVVKWYFNNPQKSGRLFLNKSLYFWSPWTNNGFLGESPLGSMNRNPWLQINPIVSIAKNSAEGENLFYGTIGKAVAWLWMTASLFVMAIGFFSLWRVNGIERLIAFSAMSQILLNWLVSLGTLGDHRQRLPILGLSIFFQAIGIKTIIKGRKNILTQGSLMPKRAAKRLSSSDELKKTVSQQ
jgi:hypothetical protein